MFHDNLPQLRAAGAAGAAGLAFPMVLSTAY